MNSDSRNLDWAATLSLPESGLQ